MNATKAIAPVPDLSPVAPMRFIARPGQKKTAGPGLASRVIAVIARSLH